MIMKSIEIRINESCKIRKENSDLQKAVYNGAENIANTVLSFAKQGVAFNKIFNCDVLKYDKYENGLFAYRHHDKARTQLRLLYRVIEENNSSAVELVSFFVKRNSNNDYISLFSKFSKQFNSNSKYEVIKIIKP